MGSINVYLLLISELANYNFTVLKAQTTTGMNRLIRSQFFSIRLLKTFKIVGNHICM
jgi:hypothetical protein